MGGKSSKSKTNRKPSGGSRKKPQSQKLLSDPKSSQSITLQPKSYLQNNNHKKKYTRIDDQYESLVEVSEALARAGLESSNLIIGIDFTKSNEWTGDKSFDGRSLHHIGNTTNPYEDAISIIGRTLAEFDEDNLIPCFGFGDASTHDKDVFSFYPNEKYCEGFEQVLYRYRQLVPELRLSGPTSFAPIIEMATTIVEQSGGQYHVLLLIADGQVSKSYECCSTSIQEEKTIKAIVKASKYPLSIVLVGVGDGPWDMMKEFDDNIPARAFDNFQFVNFTKIMAKGVGSSQKEADFAIAALMEIPCQYKALLELNLLGASRKNATQRVPLPPPCSIMMNFQSNNFCPTAPSLTQNKLCPVCVINPKSMAFNCGHQTCCKCGEQVNLCPFCSSRITTRIKLY